MEVSLNLYCCCKFPTAGFGQEEERIEEEASSNTCEDQFTCSSAFRRKGNTSRDVVINDVTLTSLKTPQWSQLVFCDDLFLVTMVVPRLFIGDEIGFSS
jgi:hypothetical protein